MPIPHPVVFAEIYNRFYDPLVFFARKFLFDPLVAEDIVTELFLKFWQKQEQFNSPIAVKTFLYISTRNACINHNQKFRKQARAKAELRILTDELEESILQTITRSELLRDIYSSVESLPTQCRKIILLSYLGGLTNQQIARHLQLSVHTVKNQKVRGIMLVRGKVFQES
ncbi:MULTISPECIES: RNA polymerase sigma factor [Niastella]|uniref:RNA polymerase sigma-70 factor n=1 Tax=Niastella soli TaxID=2821487 RepID=A0ABS3YYP5_9BACT|nr:RNA polymerase sigma-70 factor [Niastella soli]MBO9202271.1 RNA polymerase sigma-70 factor [Niastella soli]